MLSFVGQPCLPLLNEAVNSCREGASSINVKSPLPAINDIIKKSGADIIGHFLQVSL